ncbi:MULTISPECIES: peroxiredoxin [unclassified Sphingobacterium]|uniref:peroxiredoxin family protein n=1 Tax=unclassified Sphingobacterium TaxID=2609468 RepID=UPI0010479AD3|nr:MULTISPECIES: TlpA disulfide reductase family protein [unclassified Sphingobacterium]MCS3556549.1 peroxiredoxin [Sphingobacterium sp. JUb21]TCQ99845.1 peroxiredoxin [Sphingobacterium sp. JUb20]
MLVKTKLFITIGSTLIIKLIGIESTTNFLDIPNPIKRTEFSVSKASFLSISTTPHFLDSALITKYQNFIRANPNDPKSLIYVEKINLMDKEGVKSALVESYFAGLSSTLRNSEDGKRVISNLKRKRQSAVGMPAPSFTLSDQNGHQVSISEFKGQYVLIDFWATWCVPCRKELPHIIDIYKKYKNKNFSVLAIAKEKEKDHQKWLKVVREEGLDVFTNVVDFKSENVLSSYYMGLPGNCLIDPQGIIVARNLHGVALEEKLKELFN